MSNASLPYPSKVKQSAAGLWPVLKETAADWMEDNAMRLSAALALYTILSVAPLLVITTKVISVVWAHNSNAADAEVRTQLSSLMGPDAEDLLFKAIRTTSRPGSGTLATVLSVGVLLFSATGVFAELQDSMNTIWGVKPKPNQGIWGFVRNRLLSLAMVFGIGFLLLVSMFISTLLTGMADYIVGRQGWIAKTLDPIVSLLIVALLFAAIFKFLPDVKLTWRHVWLGAAMTALLFTVGKLGLAFYFTKATPTSAFGAAGAPVAVLLWIYYSAFILFFGAEFTKVWSLRRGHRIVPDESAVKVTEEDRAQKGIPSERRMKEALAGQPFNRLPPPRHVPRSTFGGSTLTARDCALAAGGLVVGAVAAQIRTLYARRHGVDAKPAGDGNALNQRIMAVEDRLVRASRIKQLLADPNAMAGIEKVQKELRRSYSNFEKSAKDAL